jgi:hypothetical protein
MPLRKKPLPPDLRTRAFSIQPHSRLTLWPSLLAALVLAAVNAPVVKAGELADEAAETFMETEGANATFLARIFGPDSHTTISLTSVVDETAKSFSYQSAPGSTYLGQSLMLSGSGAFNSMSGSWDLTISGQLGSQAWSGTGTGTFVDPPFFPTLELDLNVKPPKPPLLDYESSVTYDQTGARTISLGSISFSVLGKTVASASAHDDHILQGPDKGKWSWHLDNVQVGSQNFNVTSAGNIDNGAFQTQVAAVPEPPGWLLLGAGSLSLLVRPRRPLRAGTPGCCA